MFEAVVTACLIQSPDVCRDQLVPGYESSEAVACETALQQRTPQLVDDPMIVFDGPVFCRPAGPALAVDEIAPGVFAHLGQIAEPDIDNRGDVANVGFIVGDDAVAVVDTGTARWIGEALWRAVRERTDLPVSHVILTHMHPDHALGAAAFSGTGAQIVGHAHLSRALADRQANYIESLNHLVGAQTMIGTQAVAVDISVEEALDIELGARSVRIDAWPTAHTGTDLTVLDETTRTLFAGDLAFHRHVPALDGSLPGWRAVMARMDALNITCFVPGHGGPVLDWPAGISDLNRYLHVLESETRAAIHAGQRLSEAVETVAQSERDKWELFDAYNSRNVTVAFTELEWE